MNLDILEKEIVSEIRRYKSDEILLFVHAAFKELNNSKSIGHQFLPRGLPPFVVAGISSFAVRFSNPYRNSKGFSWAELAKIENLVSQYLLADPINYDTELHEGFKESNPVFLVLRICGSQFPYNYNPYACYSQPIMLYVETIKNLKNKENIPKFDFHTEFEKIVNTSLYNFVDIGYISWAAANGQTTGFTRGYFEKARKEGIMIPNDQEILAVLENIAATPKKFRKTYEKLKIKDRRFRIYDFNPLLMYPIIRPWEDHHLLGIDSDRLIAPIPNLIGYRISVGIYYQMFNVHKNSFSQWFGHIFEMYVGEILKHSTSLKTLFSEETIQKTYKKKAPDWAVIDGHTAILFEVKATKFSLPALTTGFVNEINESLKQVVKGLKQLIEFKDAILLKEKGLEAFYNCTEILICIVTHERLYLTNSVLFRDHINKLLVDEGINISSWLILSVQEMEILQPHLASGIGFAEILKSIKEDSYDETLKRIETLTGKTYKDSFLHKKDKEMFEHLGM